MYVGTLKTLSAHSTAMHKFIFRIIVNLSRAELEFVQNTVNYFHSTQANNYFIEVSVIYVCTC